MTLQPAPASPAGAGCEVCGGACQGFPDITPRVDYPFLPGGLEALMSSKTSSERLFDSSGALVVPEGGVIPAGVDLFTETGRPAQAAKPAADVSAKRAPARETRAG